MMRWNEIVAYSKLADLAKYHEQWFGEDFTAKDLKKYSKFAPSLAYLKRRGLVNVWREEEIEIEVQRRGYVDADGNLIDADALFEKRSTGIGRTEFNVLLGTLYQYKTGTEVIKAKRYHYVLNLDKIEDYLSTRSFYVRRYLENRLEKLDVEEKRVARSRKKVEEMLTIVD